MTTPTVCPHCNSARLAPSPSGRHLMCCDCLRIIIQELIRKPRGKPGGSKLRRAESSALAEAKK